MLFYLLEAAVLALALSLDTFAAGISLGARRIRIPAASLLALSLTCSLSLLVSILLGGLLGDWISPHAANLVSCMLLCSIGGVRLFDSLVKGLLRRCCESERSFILRFQNLKIFLQVCIDSTQADFNRSNSLSCLEAVSLAVALSLDGLVAGFGSGFSAQGGFSALVFLLSLLSFPKIRRGLSGLDACRSALKFSYRKYSKRRMSYSSAYCRSFFYYIILLEFGQG